MTTPDLHSNNTPQVINLTQLKPEVKEKAQQIATTVDIRDSQSVLQYGIGAQSNISAFSESILSQVKTKDAGYIGETLVHLGQSVKELKVDKLGAGGFLASLPFVGRLVHSVKRFITRYEKVSTQIDRIVEELEKARMQLLKDIAMLDTLYEKTMSI